MAIASGAAAGGIMGGAGAWGAQFGYGFGQLAALAASPAAGATGAAIIGADPGMGAAIAAMSSAFVMGLGAAQNWDLIMAYLEPRKSLSPFRDGRMEAGGISGHPTNTTIEMARGLIPGSIPIDQGGAGSSGGSSLFHKVESISTVVDGAGAISTAVHGYGAAHAQIRLLLGGVGGIEGMAIRGALVVNGVSGIGLAAAGSYMTHI